AAGAAGRPALVVVVLECPPPADRRSKRPADVPAPMGPARRTEAVQDSAARPGCRGLARAAGRRAAASHAGRHSARPVGLPAAEAHAARQLVPRVAPALERLPAGSTGRPA